MSNTSSSSPLNFTLSTQAYDTMKFVAQILLPALGTLYFAVSVIWGIPDAEKVVGTITAIDVFLGVVLGISSHNYVKNDGDKDGTLVIDTNDPEKDTFSFEVGTPLDEVAKKDTITLKVRNSS